MLAYNILGVPFVGSDICGFNGDTVPELCARWYILGAFYPWSRNHNNWFNSPQEPYVFANEYYEDKMTYLDIIKIGMQTKLSMVRYYYTQLAAKHVNGGAIIKPLFFEFENDKGSYIPSQ